MGTDAEWCRNQKPVGQHGLWVGEQDFEMMAVGPDGYLYQGGVKLTPIAAELNALDGAPLVATFVVGAETGGNTVNVAITLKDAGGTAVTVRGSVFAYLSNDANGDAIASATPSGGVAIGTNGLAIPVVVAKAFQLVSEANGLIDVNVVEAGAATWYLVVVLANGKLVASGAITFAA